ncbi:MAG: 23S rRNA (pseudouridine(1915)-N(3))-methyltransferase RlmH [Bacilli bacterium]|nr:23S rRNA (pseudouridine(1915)-N(3))-methyltransferase RlmH [Bacilli bacterium]
MKITIYCVGHLKESYWKEAIAEYSKRISAYSSIEVVEVDDVPYKEGSPESILEATKNKEGAKIMAKLKPSDYVCALDLNKKEYDSVTFSNHLQEMMVRGGSNVVFMIGGSLGLSDELKARANESITFSKMTLPHQLCRVVLLEQIYRAFKISHHEPYHK